MSAMSQVVRRVKSHKFASLSWNLWSVIRLIYAVTYTIE
jgi:hypothetical protein